MNLRHRQADAVDRDRPLRNHLRRQLRRNLHRHAPVRARRGPAAAAPARSASRSHPHAPAPRARPAAIPPASAAPGSAARPAADSRDSSARSSPAPGRRQTGPDASRSASSMSSAVRQTPFTAMLSPIFHRPASCGAATTSRIAPSRSFTASSVPVVSISPVNIPLGYRDGGGPPSSRRSP